MSGSDDALPALDEQTRQLIASLIQTGIQSALATRDAPSTGNSNAVAGLDPLADADADADASPGPDAAQISAGAGGASAFPARGGSDPGNINCPPGTDEDYTGGGAADDEDDDDADKGEEDVVGPQAFSAGWYATQRGRRIAPRFYIFSRFPPCFPIAFRPESFEPSEIFGGGRASAGR
jgi:hypothetical protein